MTISISQSEANNIAEAVAGLNMGMKEVRQQYHKAIGRSVLRTKNKVAHRVAKELQLPLRLIRKRLFVYKQQTKGEYKLWFGLNSIAMDRLGKPRKSGANALVKGLTAQNAYITKAGRVRLRGNNHLASLSIDQEAESLIQLQLPYIFRQEFEKNFSQLLQHKFG